MGRFCGRVRSNGETHQACAIGTSLVGVRGHASPPPENFDIRHVVRFEGSVISKLAARSELKNVDITQPLDFKVGFFSAKTTYICMYFTVLENVTISK